MDKSYSEIREVLKTSLPDVRDAVKRYLLYQRGVLHRTEFFHDFFCSIDSDNVAAIADILGSRLDEFKETLALGSRLKDEWNRVVGTVGWRDVILDGETTQEADRRIDRERREFSEKHWRGVEAMQAHFRATDPTFPP